VVHGQLAYVFDKGREYGVLEEILLYVRSVKRSHRQAVLAQIIADRRQRLLPGEVANDRNDQILALHRANKLIVAGGGQKVAGLSVQVRLGDYLFQAWKRAATVTIHLE